MKMMRAFNVLAGKLNRILDIMAPVKIIQVRTHYAPWMSLETKEMIKDRNRAQRKAVESKNWEECKKLRNSITCTLKQEKKVWQEKKLKSFGMIQDLSGRMLKPGQVGPVGVHLQD